MTASRKVPTYTSSSARSGVPVTPNNSVDLAVTPTKGIYLGTGGDLKVDMAEGETVTFPAMSGGVIHPLAVKRVHATGTTAANIVAVY